MKRTRDDPWDIIMPKLEQESNLVCAGPNEVDAAVYKQLRPLAPQLKELVVLYFSDYLMELLKFCPNLEVFSMLADEYGTDEVVKQLAEYCPLLQSVSLMYWHGVDDESLRIFEKLTNFP